MPRNRQMPISMRFPINLLDTIDEIADCEFSGNVTETVKQLVNDGIKLRNLKKTLQDEPEKQDEIIQELNERIKNESIYDWIDNLSDRQKRGFIDYINLNHD